MKKIFTLITIVITSLGALAQLSVKQVPCGIDPNCYTTIQAAVNASTAGQTITVFPGIYTENIVIKKALTLQSNAGPAVTILQGIGPADYDAPIRIYAPIGGSVSNVTIGGSSGHGFTINGIDNISAGQEASGLLLGNNDQVPYGAISNVVVSYNIFSSQGESSILSYYSIPVYINGLTINNNNFVGQTFTGAVPFPSNDQFADKNAAKPVISINKGASNVNINYNDFNVITGRLSNGNVNILVESVVSFITYNDLILHTGGFNGGMNVRGSGAVIRCNRLEGTDRQGVPSFGMYYVQTGGLDPVPYGVADVASKNTFLPLGFYYEPNNTISTANIFGFGIGANTAFPAPTCDVLPLTILQVTAKRSSDGFLNVEWLTANETDSKNFEVEMSTDGRNFTVAAKQSSKGQGNFTYQANINAPLAADIYVRIKQLDISGKQSYSDIVKVAGIKGESNLLVIGNPVRDQIRIEGMAGRTTLLLYNQQGVLLQTKITQSYFESLQVDKLPAGTYLLKVVKEDRTTQSFRIVKQ